MQKERVKLHSGPPHPGLEGAAGLPSLQEVHSARPWREAILEWTVHGVLLNLPITYVVQVCMEWGEYPL